MSDPADDYYCVGRLILAGQVTGHSHVIIVPDVRTSRTRRPIGGGG